MVDWAAYNASVNSSAPTSYRREREKDPTFASEVARTIGTGAYGFVKSMAELPNILPGVDYEVGLEPFTEAPQTGFGKFASTAIQFAIPYTAALRGLSLAARLGGLTRAAQTVKRTGPLTDLQTRAKIPSKDLFKPLGPAAPGRIGSTTSLTGPTPRLPTGVVDDFLVTPAKSLTRAQRIAHYAAGGAAADFVAFSPNDPNLSNLLSNMTEDTKIPAINAISNFLATDEDDPDALNRFRNVLEGLGLGLLIPVILKGLSKGISKTGEGISKRIPEATKAKAKEWKTKKIDGTLQSIISAGQRFKFIDDRLRHKSSLTPESKTQLGAFGKFRMLVSLKYRQKEAYEEGWKWLNPNTGAYERISPNHMSMKGIEQLKRELGPDNEDLFGKYVMAKQSEQLDRTTRGSQQPKEVYMDILHKVEVMPEVQKKFRTLVLHLQNYNDDALELLRREGRLTAEEVRAFKYVQGTGEKRIWIPQYRKNTDLDEELLSVLNKGKPKTLRTGAKHKIASVKMKPDTEGIKDLNKIKEIEEKHQADLKEYDEKNPYNDPFANLEIAYQSLMEGVMHNRVKLSLYNTIKDLGKDGKEFAIPTEKVLKKQRVPSNALRATLNKEKIEHTIEEDSMFEVFTKQYDIKPNTDIVWRDGKAEMWDIVDPLLLDSLESMGHQIITDNVKSVMRVGGWFKNTLTRLVTSAPSFFMGSNFGKDTLAVGALMKWIPFVDSFRGMYHQIINSPLAKEHREGGGTFERGAYLEFDKARNYMKDNVERIHTLDGPKGWDWFFSRVDGFTQKFEMASRTRAYQIFRAQGYSQEVATYKSREIAVDFAQHGSSTSFRIITSSVPFLNAQLQGIHRTFRALGAKTLVGGKLTAEEKIEAARAWHMTMNMSIVGGVLLPMAHHKSEDEDVRRIYAEIPTYIKDTNFVFVLPKVLSEANQLLLIPKPFDFGIIPTVVEKFLDEEYIENDSNAIKEYLWKAFRTTTRADTSILPQYIRPFADIVLNKKFTGAPIVPEYLKDTGLAERRYYTSATAIALAELSDNVYFLPNSPLKWEALLHGFTGTIGGFTMDYLTDPMFRSFLQMADIPTKAPGDRWPWEKGAIGLGKLGKIIPIKIASSKFESTRSQNEWYNIWTKINNARTTIAAYDDHADTHSIEEWNKHRNDPALREYWLQYPWAASAMNQLAEINNSIEYVARHDPHNYVRMDQLLTRRKEITRTLKEAFLTTQSSIRAVERRRAEQKRQREARNQRNASPPLNATQLREQIGMAYGGLVTRGMAEGGPANDDIIPFEMSDGMIRPYQSTEGLPRLPEGGDRPIGEAQEIRDINQRVIDARPSWTTQPDDERKYGTILPMSMGLEGDYKWAIPGMVRDFARGVVDLTQGPRTGVLTPEATMALMDVSGIGAASTAFRSGVDPNMVSAMGAGTRGVGDNRAPADLWYSPLTRAAEEWQGATATAADWENIIRNKWPGSKAEKEWSGVYEWLSSEGVANRNVSRDEVLKYVRDKELTIEESITDIHSPAYKEFTDKIGATKGYLADAEGEAGFTPTQRSELINAHRKKIDDLIKARSKLGEDTFISPRHQESNLQIPGGENYRELFLTMRKKGGLRISDTSTYGHDDPANTFARVRMNDRVVNGQRVLHIEEFQSDWNLKGREFGWSSEQARLTPEPYKMSFDELSLMKDLEDAPLLTLTPDEIAKKEELRNYFNATEKWTVENQAALNAAADMPYKGNAWTEAAFRRMLRYAAENGYDHMTWVTGKQTQDRYSLVRYIDDVTAKKNGWQEDGKDIWSIIVSTSHGPKTYTDTTDYLHEYVGKELAERIINDGGGKYSDLNLKLGGKWAENLYDKAIPNYARKLARKYGSEVGEMEFDLGHWIPGRTINVGDLEGPNLETVHSIEITPQMRESLLAEPQAVRSGGVPMIAQEGQEQDPMNPTPQISMQDGGLVKRRPQDMADGGAVWDKVKEGAGKAWDFMTEGAEDAPPPKKPSPIREIGGEIISAINHPLRYAAGKAWEATEDFRRDFDATPGNVGAYLRGIKNRGTTISMEDMNDVDKELLISSIQNRIEETGEKQGKIGYSEFDPEGKIMSFDTDGPIRMLYNSMTDPSYRLQSLFGVANYGVDDEGNPTISDTYNFGGGGSSREDIEAFVQEHGGEFRAIMEGLKQAGFAGLLNVIGNIYVGTDTEGKPYTITLDQENMADGGLVQRKTTEDTVVPDMSHGGGGADISPEVQGPVQIEQDPQRRRAAEAAISRFTTDIARTEAEAFRMGVSDPKRREMERYIQGLRDNAVSLQRTLGDTQPGLAPHDIIRLMVHQARQGRSI